MYWFVFICVEFVIFISLLFIYFFINICLLKIMIRYVIVKDEMYWIIKGDDFI